GHGREDQRRPGLLSDEPRPDGERGPEPDRPGVPRGVHQGAPDGVRDRVQPAREARDGGVARVTLARAPRAPRRAPTDLTFSIDALALSAEARSAGVVLDSVDGLIGRDARLARRLLADDRSLPLNDKLAQMTRAGWNRGVVVRVPAGVRLAEPIVIRWAVGQGGRALLTRTILDLGEGAAASLVEELEASPGAAGRGEPQALFTGSLEVHLARGADLRVASIQ